MTRLRSDATQAIADAIQDTMMRKWTPLDEAAAYVLDALLTFLETHTEDLAREAIISWGGLERAHEGIWIDARLAITSALAALRVEP